MAASREGLIARIARWLKPRDPERGQFSGPGGPQGGPGASGPGDPRYDGAVTLGEEGAAPDRERNE